MEPLTINQDSYDFINRKIEGKTIRIFVSYSSNDKVLASEIKEYLERYSLSVFLAHEDIKPTVDWQDEVFNLKGCDIFMPILTSNFFSSEWTSQETGFAYALGKTILPLKIDENPSGFITRVQALTFDCNYVKLSCLKVIDFIQTNPLFQDSLKDCLVRALEQSYSFDSANNIIHYLKEYTNFSSQQADNILRIFIKNNQVRMGAAGKEFGSIMVSKFSSITDPWLDMTFREVKNSFYSPILEG